MAKAQKHPRTPRPRRKSTTVKCRNWTAAQAAVLVALLGEHCDVTLAAPRWRVKKSEPLYTVVRLVDAGTTVEVAALADAHVDATYRAECEEMAESTARRRRPTHFVAECFRIYADVLARHGVVVAASAPQRENVMRTSIVTIDTPRGVLDARAIAARGASVNRALTALRGCVNVFRVPRGTPAVRDALFPPTN